jgi:cobalamin-dependent methionine synthase I
MIIVGERINTSRKSMAPLVLARDTEAVAAEAIRQLAAGAAFIDVNCGTMVDEEPEVLQWLVETVQKAAPEALCSIDSPNPAAIERALKAHKGKALINSVTAESARFSAILPLVRDYQAGIIALTMDDNGMPETAAERLKIATLLINKLTQAGAPLPDIYIDPMVRPVSTGDHYGQVVFETLNALQREYPGVHTICGLSNISFGLPVRRKINQAFLVMAMQAGLDSAILDPLDKPLISLLYASELLLGRDEYSANYIAAYREGKFDE